MAAFRDTGVPLFPEPVDWMNWGTPFLFFTGKGGVGKTTVASAVSLALAEGGERVLLLSMDPASNLDDVFGVRRAGADAGARRAQPLSDEP